MPGDTELDLTRILSNQANRPRTLSEVYGQDHVVSYFKAVTKRPELAVRNYIFYGPSGSGKTSLARAFAYDLVGDTSEFSGNYLEFDSLTLNDKDQRDELMSYIFSSVEGYKVVVFDEAHNLNPDVQQALLKPLDDFVGEIFFIFATTESEAIASTLESRCLPFTFRSFSTDEQFAYLDLILKKSGLNPGLAMRALAIAEANGNLRTLNNQVDLYKTVGEETYVQIQSALADAVKSYFLNPSFDWIQKLMSFPFVRVRDFVDRFFRDEIVVKKQYLRPGEIPRAYVSYLRLKAVAKTETDFYGSLYLWKEQFNPMVQDGSRETP